jgi:hypothetical protein
VTAWACPQLTLASIAGTRTNPKGFHRWVWASAENWPTTLPDIEVSEESNHDGTGWDKVTKMIHCWQSRQPGPEEISEQHARLHARDQAHAVPLVRKGRREPIVLR